MIDAPERIWALMTPRGGLSVSSDGLPLNANPEDTQVEYIRADLVPRWSDDMDAAPKDTDILVLYNHDADPYQDPKDSTRLTDYAAWTECGDFLDGRGFAIARWQPKCWEAVDEYGGGYFLPAAWFAKENDDYERVCNPTHWMPLPAPPPSDVKG